METGYPTFDLCLKLKDLGFPQLRKFQAMYYVRPDMLICIDDLSALKSDGHTDFENIFSTLVFKPRLGELWEEMQEYVQEIVKMADGTYFAYSTIEEDEDFILESGRMDKFMRARGDEPGIALMNLYIAVNNKGRRNSFTPEDAAASANKVETVIAEVTEHGIPPKVEPGIPDQPKPENVHLLNP